MTAEEIIAWLKLKPHPKEGGFFSETYRAGETIPANVLSSRYSGPRAFGTCIYYLLTPPTFSAMHRLQSDEVFHFYLGDPVEMLQLLARRHRQDGDAWPQSASRYAATSHRSAWRLARLTVDRGR